jgi:hypothetical protein
MRYTLIAHGSVDGAIEELGRRLTFIGIIIIIIIIIIFLSCANFVIGFELNYYY